MSVRLLFPTFLFQYNLLEEGLISESYLKELKADMDGMRRADPEGRMVSNAYTGWQSNDGCERRPAWGKFQRVVRDKFQHEILPFMGVDTSKVQLSLGNIWANINDKGAWNKPHGHNGCWFSGAFYVKSDGDEGHFVAMNTDPKVLSDHPHSQRMREHHSVAPTTGTLLLFTSGMIHMVEPNQTNKDRYSVAFNTMTNRMDNNKDPFDIDRDWDCFEIENNELKR